MKEFTVEEFDRLKENHVFSKRYQKQKRKVLRKYTKSMMTRRTWLLVTVGALLAGGALFAAMSHAGFYHFAFGTEGKQNAPVREETALLDKGYEEPVEVTYTYPSHEYVEADEEQAESLVGDYAQDEPVQFTVRDHRFTIVSAVRDQNVMVLEYTIENLDGNPILDWHEHSEDWHGATVKQDNNFFYYLNFGEDDGALMNEWYSKTYVDEEKSTDAVTYAVDYVTFAKVDYEEREKFFDTYPHEGGIQAIPPLQDGESPSWIFITYDPEPDRSIVSLFEDGTIQNDDELTHTTYDLQVTEALPFTVFTSKEDGYMEISPIGMRVDVFHGFTYAGDETEPWDNPEEVTVIIHYKDGSSYTVYDKNGPADNTGNLHTAGTWWYAAFNRLVDVDEIDYIQFNGVIYTISK